jgi:hypothetical protein
VLTRQARAGPWPARPGPAGARRDTRDPAPRERDSGAKNTFHVGETVFARAARGRRAENAEERSGPPGNRGKAAKRTGEKHNALRKTQVFVYNMGMAEKSFSDVKTGEKIILKNTCGI